MKSIAKLKDEARKHEQKEEWEKAIKVYLQVLEIAEGGEAEVELPLYNRVGDLCVRLGRPLEAVRHYEQAADRYAEAGLYNNAIALCNKALRYNADHLPLMRKLGQFSASQGFITDARRYFLEYAERQFAAGEVDDALSALEDFANVADDAEVRELLGRRLQTHGRSEEAVQELQRAWSMRVAAGETEQADALRAEIAAIDPDASIDAARAPRPVQPEPDYDAELPELGEIDTGAVLEGSDIDRGAADSGTIAGFETGRADDDAEPADFGTIEISGFDGETAAAEGLSIGGLEGLEPTTLDLSAIEPPAGLDDDLGLERDETSFDLPTLDVEEESGFDLPTLDAGDDDAGFELPAFDAGDAGGFDLPTLDAEEAGGFELPTLDTEEESGFELPTLDAEEESGFELPTLDAEEESGFDLPTLDAEEGEESGFELPTLATEEESSFELPTLDTEEESGFDLPTVDAEEEGGFELPSLDSGEEADLGLPTLDSDGDGDFVLPSLDAEDDTSFVMPSLDAEIEDTVASETQASDDADVAAEPAAAEEPEPADTRWTPEMSLPPAAPAAPRESRPQPPAAAAAAGGDFIDLGALLSEDDEDTTRFRVQETAPTGDEDRDFAELLNQFKAKVSEHLPAEDAAAHYDLGLAFKEMGLVDEAIAEFQIALRAGHMRLKVYEELGHCFLQKEQFNIAEKVLRRALDMKYEDELELLGVYYHLGRAYEGMGRRDQARDAYERVLGMDINFQDVTERLARL